jgi:hypothetical protein
VRRLFGRLGKPMSAREATIVPLDDAHELLEAFGIGPYSRGYQRWRRDDGFRQVDLEGVLTESPAVLTVDWRESLADAVDTIAGQLERLGLEVASDLGEDGNGGVLQVGGLSAQIRFVPADADDFDRVIAVVNGLIAPTAEYRKFRSCEGSDGWSYAVLKNADWQALDTVAGPTVRQLFV